MTYIFRPNHYNVTDSATARVYEPGGAALPWWNPDGATPAATCGAWQAKGAPSLAASYLNLATLGNANIDPAVVGGVAPTWAAGTGWTGDGLSIYLKTGITPLNTQTWSALATFTITNAGFIFGSRNGGGVVLPPYFYIRPNAGGRYYGNGGLAGGGGSILNGNICFAGTSTYANGLPDVFIIPASAGVMTEVFIMARNNGVGTAVDYMTGTIAALAIYNVTLTAAQVLARATAMSLL